ncbi:LPXTG cell wall anchor domain-containing protein [Streptomyces sp. NPDC048717]|uniref:LPXTG cell wall anchor domain-containing protein n=1 Tax=Streptomyces sp. NPDC048717 TaxID=3154928 RepID=UPI0034130E4F
MKIRRIAATAVAAAVTAPALFLSAAPAFADTKPATGASQTADAPSIHDLELALAAAEAAYETAKKNVAKADAALEALTKADHPLAVALVDAKKASDEAAAAKTTADAAVTKAEQDLAALPEDATDEQKAAAQKLVDDAKTAATAAQATATAKAAEVVSAQKALDDARVAAATALSEARKAEKTAEKAVEDAEKALDEAEGSLPDDCPTDKNLGTSLTGPSKIAVGSSGVFTFRVTNKGTSSYDEVGGYAAAFAMTNSYDWQDLGITWSTAGTSWKALDDEEGFHSGAPLAGGKSVDFKLKVSVPAKTKVGDGAVMALGLRVNKDVDCGSAADVNSATFSIVKPAKPGSGNNNGTNGGHSNNGSTGGSNSGNGNSTPQGGTSTTPVNTTSSGSLANTGAGSSTLPFALAGGAAVVLGAGAMVMVRRRKAGMGA